MTDRDDRENNTQALSLRSAAPVAQQQRQRPTETRLQARREIVNSLRGPAPASREEALALRDGRQSTRRETTFLPRDSAGNRINRRTGQRVTGNGASLRSPINTRLASGVGANGEPVFDNRSIQRGVQSGVLPDPNAEQQRIENNQEQQRRTTLRTLPQDIASGQVTPEAGQVIQTGENQRATLRENARQFNVANQQERSNQSLDEASTFGATVLQDLTGDENVQLSPNAVANTARAIADGSLPFSMTNQDIGMLAALSDRLPDLDRLWDREPAGGLGPQVGLEMVRQLALNSDANTLDVAGGTIALSKIPRSYRTTFEGMAARVRNGFLQSAEAKLQANQPLTQEEQTVVDAERQRAQEQEEEANRPSLRDRLTASLEATGNTLRGGIGPRL